jgi:hypothetical protein
MRIALPGRHHAGEEREELPVFGICDRAYLHSGTVARLDHVVGRSGCDEPMIAQDASLSLGQILSDHATSQTPGCGASAGTDESGDGRVYDRRRKLDGGVR